MAGSGVRRQDPAQGRSDCGLVSRLHSCGGGLQPPFKNGLRLLGRRYDVEKDRPDAIYIFVCVYATSLDGHCLWPLLRVRSHYSPFLSRDSLLTARANAAPTSTDDLWRGVCKAKARGAPVTKCSNCRGQHVAQASACPKREEARQAANGWRSPPPPLCHRGSATAPSPPDSPPPETTAVEEEVEVEA